MPAKLDYGRPLDERELMAYADAASDAFSMTPEEARAKFSQLGPETMRVIRRRGRIVAGLLRHPAHQWFWGRRLSCAAIGAVATVPEARGEGIGLQIMQTVVREAHRDGIAVSALYPATRRFYGLAGYELAGGHYETTLFIQRVAVRARDLEIREAEPADLPALARAHARAVAQDCGPLDRYAPEWQEGVQIWAPPCKSYVVLRKGRIEGHMRRLIVRKDQTINTREFFAATPEAGRRMLGFIADHRTQGEKILLFGRPFDPLLMMMPELAFQVRARDWWMLRVVDVERALRERGYAPAAAGRMVLSVQDDLVSENQGRFTLEVADGRGRVRRGGRGGVRIDIRGLAALFTGHLSAAQLSAWTPHLNATPKQAAVLDGLFQGPRPWMGASF